MDKKYRRLKLACYSGNFSMALVGNLPPLLFLTFRELYGISYSLLGLLILLNFFTQLIVDLIFSFFSHKFNIPGTVKFMPYLTLIGFLIYALWPIFHPDTAYVGLVVGTIVFSASAGLAEVLISPVVATIPADEPDREMSKLHSIYAWGTVVVVVLSTLFLLAFGRTKWYVLVLIASIIPLISIMLYSGADVPSFKTEEKGSETASLLRNKALWLSVLAIFFGGSAECTMAQWSSGYLEQVFDIPKVWGDIFGVALFAVMLGLGRSLYGKYGKNLVKVLLVCAITSSVCYFVAAVSSVPVVGLIACALTGLCTSMLWPGNLVVATDRFPTGGVVVFALMAAGGDMGASIGPQLVGFITDAAIANPSMVEVARNLMLTPEQFGMKLGMLVGMLFPLSSVFIFVSMCRSLKKA